MSDSVQYAKLVDQVENDSLRPDELHGRVRVAYFEHTTSEEAVAATINLTKLPAGARVVGFLFSAVAAVGDTNATLEIGDSGDSDRLVSDIDVDGAVAINAASTLLRTPDAVPTTIGFGYRYTSATIITATVRAAALLDAKTFSGVIFYVVD